MKIKLRTAKDWENFWYYYKLPVFAVAAAVALVVFVILDITSVKPVVFSAIFFEGNCKNEHYQSEFAEFAGIDLNESDILFKDNMSLRGDETGQQANGLSYLSIRMLAREIDAVVLNPEEFDSLGEQYFVDLRTCFDHDFLNYIGDALYFISKENSAENEKIPIGIKLDKCSYFLESFYTNGYVGILGVCIGTNNPETTVKFIEFLFSYPENN